MSYVEPTELREYLRSKVVADEVEIEAAQLAADSGIDDYCQRSFVAGAGTATKTFTGTGGTVLDVPDLVSVSQVVDAGGTLTASDYTLGRWSDTTAREWPYSQIQRVDGTPWTDVSVTATWGWTATPPEVKIASRLLVRDLLMARDMSFGIVQVGEFSRRIAENGVVEMLLAPLRRPEALPVA